jgi:3-isopropylmalate/(R)-2-methylmalate dehydratase small subunit
MTKLTIKGRAIKLGDDISTDDIIPGRFAHLRSNLPELAQHVLEDAVPGFTAKVKSLLQEGGNKAILVAGRNFGLGSSREHAPLVIKMSGISAIVAQSVARIFFRNAINQGLPVLLCDTSDIGDGDLLEVNLGDGTVANLTSNLRLHCNRLPPIVSALLEEGGLVSYIRKHQGFVLD